MANHRTMSTAAQLDAVFIPAARCHELRVALRTRTRRLPRGSSDPKVKIIGRELCAALGPDMLLRVARGHFKTANQIAPVSHAYV